jgi:hypothetical protein
VYEKTCKEPDVSVYFSSVMIPATCRAQLNLLDFVMTIRMLALNEEYMLQRSGLQNTVFVK